MGDYYSSDGSIYPIAGSASIAPGHIADADGILLLSFAGIPLGESSQDVRGSMSFHSGNGVSGAGRLISTASGATSSQQGIST
jgi:hypothetical protein